MEIKRSLYWDIEVDKPIEPSHNIILSEGFWFWLGVDQLAHVILNIVFALFIEWIFFLFYIPQSFIN
jgi:hypothetical protein